MDARLLERQLQGHSQRRLGLAIWQMFAACFSRRSWNRNTDILCSPHQKRHRRPLPQRRFPPRQNSRLNLGSLLLHQTLYLARPLRSTRRKLTYRLRGLGALPSRIFLIFRQCSLTGSAAGVDVNTALEKSYLFARSRTPSFTRLETPAGLSPQSTVLLLIYYLLIVRCPGSAWRLARCVKSEPNGFGFTK